MFSNVYSKAVYDHVRTHEVPLVHTSYARMWRDIFVSLVGIR